MKIPEHVAIILDGNGRWAKAKGLPRTAGHKAGAQTMLRILEDADDIGIRYLTVYAFSTENWNRPKAEVHALMEILRRELTDAIPRSMKNNVRCRVIGERTRLSRDLLFSIEQLERETAGNTGLQFTIAINYGARDEITRAVKKIAANCVSGAFAAEEVDENVIASFLDTRELPDPDLLIRTTGEQRISNFLLWQCAYTEFYFSDLAWPDFDKAELLRAIESYNRRVRKFGGLKEEKEESDR